MPEALSKITKTQFYKSKNMKFCSVMPPDGLNEKHKELPWPYRDGGYSFPQGSIYRSGGDRLVIVLHSLLVLPDLHYRCVQVSAGQRRLQKKEMCINMYTFTGLLYSDYRYILIAKYPQQKESKT